MFGWSRVPAAVLLLGVLATLASCTARGRPSYVASSTDSSATVSTMTAAATSSPVTSPPLGGIAMLRDMGARVKETTEAATVSAGAAIARAAGSLLSPTLGAVTVTATKARLTDTEVKNRLVWIVTAGPLTFRGFGGPRGAPQRLHVGQVTLVIDANTGQRLRTVERGLP